MCELIDLHNHALPGVDDGAHDLSETVRLLEGLSREGVGAVCFTPHYNPAWCHTTAAESAAVFRETAEALRTACPGMRLYLGSEVYVYPDTADALRAGLCRPLGGGNTVLVEFSPPAPYDFLRNAALALQGAGFHPLLAHAERYAVLLRDPALVRELREMRVGIQLNAQSVVAPPFSARRAFARRLLRDRMVDVIASDAHTPGRYGMRRAYLYVKKTYGETYAARIFHENPLRYLTDRL